MEQEVDKYTRTTNGAVALSKDHFKTTYEKSLVALNTCVSTKKSEGYEEFLEKLFVECPQKEFKVLGSILIMHFRDIDKGKGLRKPFLNSLIYLYSKGHTQFVCNIIKQIPTYGYYKDLCNLYLLATQKKYDDLKAAILEFYSAELKREEQLAAEDKRLTNCGKFAPRQQKKFNQLSKDLARHMFPDSNSPDKNYRLLLKKIMDKYKQITEVLMSAKKWDEIDPKYVPSLCFNYYKKAFLNYEGDIESRQLLKEKYEEHINNALEGKDGAKINAKRLTIDSIVKQHNSNIENELEAKALEAQVLDILNDVKKGAQLLTGCLAVCDVSGSMSGDPMNACIGLGLIINEVNQLDYKNSLISFDDNPSWINLDGCDTFGQKIDRIQQAPWGGSTNFYKTMKLIADEGKIYKKLPKAIFVFSDMQFNQASRHGQNWKETYKLITEYFTENGFEEQEIPSIIFWNLRASIDNFVVDNNQQKVICISGYSQSLLKSIVQAEDLDYILSLTPFTFLLEVLNSKRYDTVKEVAENFF